MNQLKFFTLTVQLLLARLWLVGCCWWR